MKDYIQYNSITKFFDNIIEDLHLYSGIHLNWRFTIKNCNITYFNKEFFSNGVSFAYYSDKKLYIKLFKEKEGLTQKQIKSVKNHTNKLMKYVKEFYIYDYIDYVLIDEDENNKLLKLEETNYPRYWLLTNIKCSLIKKKETCSIDLEQYKEVIKTECNHFFNEKNLYSWLDEHNNNSCPICRNKLLNKLKTLD